MLGLWTFLAKSFGLIHRLSNYTQPHIHFKGHTSPCKHRWPHDSWSWLSSYFTAHLWLSFSAHFPSDYTLWFCFIWLTNWIFFSAQKFTQCLFHMAPGEKKICCSIHHTNRKKTNYSHYSSPNTYLYSFPRSGKLKDSKGSFCQYLFCSEWVQEKNTQWC